METFILVLFFSVAYRNDAPWTTVEFNNQQRCEAAGKAIVEKASQTTSFICVQK